MQKEISCGAILYCDEEKNRKYVLVMEPNGNYGFPKGHKEGNETDIETAIREIKEETGVNCEFIPNMKRTIRYSLANGSTKEVVFFVAKFRNQELHSSDKNILAIKKFELEEALNMLKFKELRNILIEVDYMLELKGV